LCEGVREEGGRPPGRGQAARSRRPPSPPPWPTRILFVSPPKPPPPLVANSRKNFFHRQRAATICFDHRQPERRCLPRSRRQRPHSSAQARARRGTPPPHPPRSHMLRCAGCCCCCRHLPCHSRRPLLPAIPPSPLPLVRRRRPPRAPITRSTHVIRLSPCSGAAIPWPTRGGAVPWRLHWLSPLSSLSPSGRLLLPPRDRIVSPYPSHLSMHPCRPRPPPSHLSAPPCTQVVFGAVFRSPLREPSPATAAPFSPGAPSSAPAPTSAPSRPGKFALGGCLPPQVGKLDRGRTLPQNFPALRAEISPVTG